MIHKKMLAALGPCLAASVSLQSSSAGVQAVGQTEVSELGLGLASFRDLDDKVEKDSHGPPPPHDHLSSPPSLGNDGEHRHPEPHHSRRLGGDEEKDHDRLLSPPFKGPHVHPKLYEKSQLHPHRHLGEVGSFDYGYDYGDYGYGDYGYGDYGYGNYGYGDYGCDYGHSYGSYHPSYAYYDSYGGYPSYHHGYGYDYNGYEGATAGVAGVSGVREAGSTSATPREKEDGTEMKAAPEPTSM